MIRPVLSYASLIWSSCDKEHLYRVHKLLKQAAGVILYAYRQVSSVPLFNKLFWILFYEQSRIWNQKSDPFDPATLFDCTKYQVPATSRTTQPSIIGTVYYSILSRESKLCYFPKKPWYSQDLTWTLVPLYKCVEDKLGEQTVEFIIAMNQDKYKKECNI